MQDERHDAKITGAAFSLILIDYDDNKKIYTIWPEPLSDKENIELDAWVRAYYLYIQRSNIPENATDEEKDRIERIAQQIASTLNWYSDQGIRIMASIEGMTQIMYMSIRKRSPELTPEKLRHLLMDERNLDEANKAFEALNLSDTNPTQRGTNQRGTNQRGTKKILTKKRVKPIKK